MPSIMIAILEYTRLEIVFITIVMLTNECQAQRSNWGQNDEWENSKRHSSVQYAHDNNNKGLYYGYDDSVLHNVYDFEIFDSGTEDNYSDNEEDDGDGDDDGDADVDEDRYDNVQNAEYNVNYVPEAKEFEQKEGHYRYPDSALARSRHCSVEKEAIANCSYLKLKKIPQNLPKSITSLLLDNNKISHLPDKIFSRYWNLRYLDLSFNRIRILCNQSFFGLKYLEQLNISYNNISYRKTSFPSGVFQFLQRLTHLNISHNTDTKNLTFSYPDESLSKLKNLQVLRMDGLYNTTFGPGFKEMSSLKELYITGYNGGFCNFEFLHNHTFQYLTGLTTLKLESCYIQHFEKGSFLPLIQLQELSLKHNEDFGVENLNSLFYSLQNATKLERLNLHLIVNRYSLGICLDHTHIRLMPRTIKYLNVQENNLAAVDRFVIGMLPPELKEIDLTGNHFVLGTYLKDIHKMKSLEKIKINGGSFRYQIPKMYPFGEPKINNVVAKSDTVTNPISSAACSLYDDFPEGVGSSRFILTFPPNLKTIEMENAGLTYTLSRWEVDPNNTVENIFIGKNQFNLLFGPIIGFDKLKQLDIRESFVEFISNDFFRNLSSLEVLELPGNLLGHLFSAHKNTRCFLKLTNLKHLDLSFNAIRNLPQKVFDGLRNLEYLYLNENSGLTRFVADISHMTQLKFLSLRNTQIVYLPVNVRSHIDALLLAKIDMAVDLTGDPILCECRNLIFLKWMSNSKAFDKSFKYYECRYKDFSRKILQNGYNQTIDILSKECTDHVKLFIVVAAVCLISVLVLLCLVCYRFRWKIRYVYYCTQLYLTKNHTRNRTEFEFDVFVSYANDDSDLVMDLIEPELRKRNLKVLNHARDFLAGRFIGSNIVDAISKSKKTLVLFTQYTLKSDWCRYEIHMANEESLKTGKQVLMFLMKYAPAKRIKDLDIVYSIKNNTYLELPDPKVNASIWNVFWDKLARDIRS